MTPAPSSFRIGTRASPLAMAQAEMVRDALVAAHATLLVELVPMVASGDKVQDRALAEIGGKALWTKELDAALLEGRIDCAVHSMKDVETLRPETLSIAAMLPREDVRDRLIGAASIAALPEGARLGTSAPRRTAQMLRTRPDLEICLLRGNVQTRLAKIDAGEVDATLLAAAGLKRLGINRGVAIDVGELLPAPAQGAIGIEIRSVDAEARALVEPINHADTFNCVMAERALLEGLNAGCRSPVAALAQCAGGHIHLQAEIYSADGSDCVSGEVRFAESALKEASGLAQRLLAEAAPNIRMLFE